MDLITFIKKEEPVDYVLTTDDCEKVKAQSKELSAMVRSLPIYWCDLNISLYWHCKEKFTAVIKQEDLNGWSDSGNENTERNKVKRVKD